MKFIKSSLLDGGATLADCCPNVNNRSFDLPVHFKPCENSPPLNRHGHTPALFFPKQTSQNPIPEFPVPDPERQVQNRRRTAAADRRRWVRRLLRDLLVGSWSQQRAHRVLRPLLLLCLHHGVGQGWVQMPSLQAPLLHHPPPPKAARFRLRARSSRPCPRSGFHTPKSFCYFQWFCACFVIWFHPCSFPYECWANFVLHVLCYFDCWTSEFGCRSVEDGTFTFTISPRTWISWLFQHTLPCEFISTSIWGKKVIYKIGVIWKRCEICLLLKWVHSRPHEKPQNFQITILLSDVRTI